jgi:hypothetical protein
MRYELKNLGPGPFFSIELGKLLQPGDSINVNRIDDGTKRLATGPNPRLAILDRAAPAAAPQQTATQQQRPARPKSAPAGPVAPDQSAAAPPAAAESATAKRNE